MDQLKKYVAGAVVLSLAILGLGYNFLVSPKKSAAEELRAQTASQDSTNATLRTKLALLKSQAKDLPKEQAKLAAVAAKIPENPALPSLIRALTTASVSAGVVLVSLTPSAPTAVAAAAPAAPAAPPSGAPAAAAPAPAAAPAAAGAPAASTAGMLSSIPISLNVVGSYFQVQRFLANLESLPRAFRVTALTLTPGANPLSKATGPVVEDGRSLSSTITAQVFMASNRAPATPVTIPAPAASAAAAKK